LVQLNTLLSIIKCFEKTLTVAASIQARPDAVLHSFQSVAYFPVIIGKKYFLIWNTAHTIIISWI